MALIEIADRVADAAYKSGTVTATVTGAAGGVAQFLGYTADQWTIIGTAGGLLIGAVGMIAGKVIDLYYRRKLLALQIKHLEASDKDAP